MNYIKRVPLCFDIEATYGKQYGRISNPFAEDTSLCCIGWKLGDQPVETAYYVKEIEGKRIGDQLDDSGRCGYLPTEEAGIIVGANIKFDLIWLLTRPHNENIWSFFQNGGMLWDVSYAEYLLSGQAVNNGQVDERFRPSLNACLSLNGMEYQKIDVIKKLWKDDVRTEDIHEDLLLEYQVVDVQATYDVYMAQLKRAVAMGPKFMANLRARMRGLFATMWMEFNGLTIDNQKGLEIAAQLQQRLDRLNEGIKRYLPELPKEYEFNAGSNKQLSAFLFGGTVKYKARVYRVDKEGALIFKKIEVPDIDPKTGKQKQFLRGKNKGKLKFKKVAGKDPDTKWGEKRFKFPRQFEPQEKWAAADEGFWSVAADVMKDLKKQNPNAKLLNILDMISSVSKDLGTYYITTNKAGKQKGMLTCIGPDQKIHHALQHYVTATGRLSCTNPNLQNVPGGDKSNVKQLFISRFGEDGVMMEADYSQLEVVTKTVLCKDEQLRKDLLDGVCFHCVNLALAEHMDPWEVQKLAKGDNADPKWVLKRKKIKPFTFQEKYGGGAKLMADSTGLSVDEINAIIEAKKARYPQETEFDEKVFANANKTLTASPFRTPKGYPARVGYHLCETGTLYSFIESDAPDWKKDRDKVYTALKPTQTKNYPSQGLGGFIMQDAIGIIAEWLLTRPDLWNKAKLVNTVHDCCWIDCHKDVADEVAAMVQAIMQDVNWRFEQMFGKLKGWDVPFPAEVEVGPNMLHLEHWHKELHEPFRIKY